MSEKPQKLFKNAAAYPEPWLWPHFSPKELACRCCGELYIDDRSIDALEDLREAWGRPIIITSAHRCAGHNREVGGVEGSQHRKIAFDCTCPAAEQPRFIELAKAAGFTGIGRYPKRGFVHLDCGPVRTWRG